MFVSAAPFERESAFDDDKAGVKQEKDALRINLLGRKWLH